MTYYSDHEHAKERLQERYGLTISNVGLNELVTRIQMNDGLFLYATSKYRTVRVIDYAGSAVKLVYSNRDKRIVTFLPLGRRDVDDYAKYLVEQEEYRIT